MFKFFLIIHIVSGVLSLISGTINLIRKKGDEIHRFFGRIFVLSMLVSGFTAFILSLIHPNYFLFMVGVFTVYMVSSGVRYLRFKPLVGLQKATFLDWFISAAMLISGILFVGFGVLQLSKSNFFGVVFLSFGLIGMLFVYQDYKNFKGITKSSNFWMIAYIGRITGAYIASLTAFLVVNIKYVPIELPAFIVWLFPTAIIVPFIIRWTRSYNK